jgi:type II secretory pathway component PulF
VTGSYRYRAARTDGGIVRGELEAASGVQAGALLEQQGLYPIAIDPVVPTERSSRSASRAELAMVFRSLATLAAAGVPLERAMSSSEAIAATNLRVCFAAGRMELRAGKSLADALDVGHGVVPSVVLGVLRAGERAGRLVPALEQAALQLEREAELAASLRQALAYPALLLVTGVGSMLVIGGVVTPRFAALLADLGQDLPLSTRAVLGVSSLLTRYWALLVAGFCAAAGLTAWWGRTPRGRLQLHDWLLDVPVIGPIRHALATARAARALAGALGAGMHLLPALDAAAAAAGDQAVGRRLGAARERVALGEPLALALARERALAPAGLQLLEVGEQSAQLAVMAGRAGDLTGRDAERRLRALAAMIEPALIVALGGMVAFTAVALLQALYEIRPGGL